MASVSRSRFPIEVAPNEHNRCYLECKKLKIGHLLQLVEQ